MKSFQSILFLVCLIVVSGCRNEEKVNPSAIQELFGDWRSYSTPCLPNTILRISDGYLEYVSEGYVENYILIDTNNFYPKAYANMPENKTRFIVKLKNPKYKHVENKTYVSLSAYYNKNDYSGTENTWLILLRRGFKSDKDYFSAKNNNINSSIWSACVYTKI